MELTSTDIYESSYFLSQGAHLENVRYEQRKRPTIVFFFKDKNNSEPLNRLQSSYHNGVAHINLATYRSNLEKLKDIMFGELEQRKMFRNRKNN